MLILGVAAIWAAAAAYGAARARAVADLSALAGAAARVDMLVGRVAPEPCVAAAEVAARNGATLQQCLIDGSVNVSVRVAVPLMGSVSGAAPGLSLSRAATAAARAGPAVPTTQP